MTNQPRQGAVPCPFCHTAIAVSIESLLAGHSLHCPQCDAELQVNQETSAGALNQLQQWQAQQKAAPASPQQTESVAMIPRQRKPNRYSP